LILLFLLYYYYYYYDTLLLLLLPSWNDTPREATGYIQRDVIWYGDGAARLSSFFLSFSLSFFLWPCHMMLLVIQCSPPRALLILYGSHHLDGRTVGRTDESYCIASLHVYNLLDDI
jgi:hypothetical protein